MNREFSFLQSSILKSRLQRGVYRPTCRKCMTSGISGPRYMYYISLFISNVESWVCIRKTAERKYLLV